MATTNQPKLQPIFFILSHLFSFLTNKKFKMNMICNIKFKKKKKKKTKYDSSSFYCNYRVGILDYMNIVKIKLCKKNG